MRKCFSNASIPSYATYSPTDRYYLMCEYMEWIVNEWDEIEVDWLEEIKI